MTVGSPVAAETVVRALAARAVSVATAESLTGGLLCARLVDLPGASDVVRGGVVAYTADLKTALLGVDADLVRRCGTVDPHVAEQMAVGVRRRLAATYGVATTGVAGPGPAEGKPAGTVFVAVAGPRGVRSVRLALAGTRAEIRSASVEAALSALLDTVEMDTVADESDIDA